MYLFPRPKANDMLQPMRHFVLVLALTTSVFAAGEWYTGGTLHKKTGLEWLQAMYDNRLATAADFYQVMSKPKNLDDAKDKATALESCITQSLTKPKDVPYSKWKVVQERPVGEMALTCGTLLGFRN